MPSGQFGSLGGAGLAGQDFAAAMRPDPDLLHERRTLDAEIGQLSGRHLLGRAMSRDPMVAVRHVKAAGNGRGDDRFRKSAVVKKIKQRLVVQLPTSNCLPTGSPAYSSKYDGSALPPCSAATLALHCGQSTMNIAMMKLRRSAFSICH